MTKALLDEHRGALTDLAEALLEREWLDGDEADLLIRRAMGLEIKKISKAVL